MALFSSGVFRGVISLDRRFGCTGSATKPDRRSAMTKYARGVFSLTIGFDRAALNSCTTDRGTTSTGTRMDCAGKPVGRRRCKQGGQLRFG